MLAMTSGKYAECMSEEKYINFHKFLIIRASLVGLTLSPGN